MLGLCLVAMLAVVAVAATSASANGPEIGQCYAKKGGKYADSNCQTKAKKGAGAYEWRKASEMEDRAITTEGGAGVLSTNIESGEELFALSVECQEERGAGEITSKGTGLRTVVVYFYGCKLFGAVPCSNSSEAEVIVTNPLQATFGYINKAKKEVGVDVTPQKKHGEFAKFICGGSVETVVGAASSKEKAFYPGKGGGDGIISPIGPVDQMGSTETQVYWIDPETNENIPGKFEGKPLQELEDYIGSGSGGHSPWAAGGETLVNKAYIQGEEAEIKA